MDIHEHKKKFAGGFIPGIFTEKSGPVRHAPCFRAGEVFFQGPYRSWGTPFFIDMITEDGKSMPCWVEFDLEMWRIVLTSTLYDNICIVNENMEKMLRYMFIQLNIKGINPREFPLLIPSVIKPTLTMKRFNVIRTQYG